MPSVRPSLSVVPTLHILQTLDEKPCGSRLHPDVFRFIDEPKICLVELMGHFNGQSVHMLPTSIKELRLALADDHDALDWCEALPKLSHVLPSLRNICKLPSLTMSLH